MKTFIGQAKNRQGITGVSEYGLSSNHTDGEGNPCYMVRGTFTMGELLALADSIRLKNTKEFVMPGTFPREI